MKGTWDVITMMTFFLVSLFIKVLNLAISTVLSAKAVTTISVSPFPGWETEAQKGEVNLLKPHSSGKTGIRKPQLLSFGLRWCTYEPAPPQPL